MVNGIDIFREHFNHFKEQYTVIGGFACDLLMNDAGLDFRQTVDIDMVLIVEALTTDFAKPFGLLLKLVAIRPGNAVTVNRSSIVLWTQRTLLTPR